jgi:cell division protein FtsL
VRLDNSQLVRERDPRAGRELVLFLLLVAVFVAGALLYAFPHLELRRTGIATEQMQLERERLQEENRKLRLEKASLENLSRVEAIAGHQLGLETPAPERVIVVERPATLPEAARLARGHAAAEQPRN